MKPFTYKGYLGAPVVDTDAGVIRGLVINARDTITFQGGTVSEAEHEFHESVDDYLEFCAQRGVKPEKPFSGKFPVRTKPSVHQALVTKAARRGVSLNKFVEEVLTEAARLDDDLPIGARGRGEEARAGKLTGPEEHRPARRRSRKGATSDD